MKARWPVLCLFLLSLLGLLTGSAQARVIRVWRDAPGPVHDGASWEQAFTTVSEGLSASFNADEIWVAEGTYPERIQLRYGVPVYGGFSGSETSRDQRNPKAHITTLDGEGKGIVVLARTDAVNTVLDGFHLINGHYEHRSYYGPGNSLKTGDVGGGIFCEHASTLFANLVIRDCAGIGLDCRGDSAPVLRDSIVSDNVSFGVFSEDSAPIITRNTIERNSAGIYSQRSSATIRDNIIAENGYGAQFSLSHVDLVNNTITRNRDSGANIASTPSGQPGDVNIVNNIVAYNGSGLTGPGTVAVAASSVHHNVIARNYAADYVAVADPAVPAANIARAPGFVDLRGGGYHLSPVSPCIDAGDDGAVQPGDTDIDGQSRIQLQRVDIGADESTVPQQAPVPTVVRVRLDGDDAGDGSTWGTALRTLQTALDVAGERGGGEVWVAEGVYPAHLDLYPGVSLYGGFTGTETERTGTSPLLHPTILDGQRQGTVITARSGYGDPSVIDGFRIQYGAPSTTSPGPGIVCQPGSAPRITRNIIQHNTSSVPDNASVKRPSGGIYSENASPVVSGNLLVDNGGAAFHSVGGAPTISFNTISGNSGTGIWLSGSPAQVENNIVAYNLAGIRVDAGAQPVFRGNCVFGNGGYAYSGVADPTGSDGNIAADPRLASYRFGNWHIQPDSPCVDAAQPGADPPLSADIDGQPRVQGARRDIGADESDGTNWTVAPRVVRVRPDGDDARDGSSWAQARRTMGAAIALARDTGGEVWVAAGSYTEVVTLPPHVYVYGGFAGQEPDRTSRDWRANATVLLYGAPAAVRAEFGYRNSALDGFTIRSIGPDVYADGVQCVSSSPEIANCTIRVADAGIIGTGAPAIHDCTILPENVVYGRSGIVISAYDAPVQVSNNVIRSFSHAVALSAPGSLVANNAIVGGDTGIDILNSPSSVIVNNTVIGVMGVDANATGVGIEAASSTLVNNLVAFGDVGINDSLGASLALRYNDSYGNAVRDYPAGIPDPTGADGNISQDPLLISPDDVHIRPESPCRDAGDDGAVAPGWRDIDGQPRIQGAHVDIGADEVALGLAFTVTEARQALSIAAGLAGAESATIQRLNVVPDGASSGVVNLADAVRLLRKAMWLEPNP